MDYRTNRDLFAGDYLDSHLPETEEWEEVDDEEVRDVREEVKSIYQSEAQADKIGKTPDVKIYNESQLEDNFIKPILEAIGSDYEVQEKAKEERRWPDYGFFESEQERSAALQRKAKGLDFYQSSIAVGDAKQWERKLDKIGDGDKVRDFSNPSHQIDVYLRVTPPDWAILTNGKQWRLYYSETSHQLDSYYEIDLQELLETDYDDPLEEFKYFYLFFRQEAFIQDKTGKSFLDRVYDRSNLFVQELGENLQDNIYEAIGVLAEGILDCNEELDPDEKIDLIHDSSLTYLYRLIFVLYAESDNRNLLNARNEVYKNRYSLNSLKKEVAQELDGENPIYVDWDYNLWERLNRLFTLIDKGSKNLGIPEDELYIPAYNGGLFDTDENASSREARFLQENRVGDSYIAEIIDLLTRSESEDGGEKEFIDYSSLDIRHLGSIYEGLLEYKLNIADEPRVAVKDDGEEIWVLESEFDEEEQNAIDRVEEDGVYLTTDDNERKVTGSYYTPEYIVQYIVEQTLDPLIEEIHKDLLASDPWSEEGNYADRFAERIFELNILDPAMGSGHFLKNTIDHLAREIINARELQADKTGEETIDETHGIHWARRQVAQKCIYGVDKNSMAVELAKVSLWLRTLAAEKPLVFLDHHLKTGNSLIGADIDQVSNQLEKQQETDQDTTLDDFGATKKTAIEELREIYEDFIEIEIEDLEDADRVESKYEEYETLPLKERLEAIANIHISEEYGVEVSEGDYRRMASAIKDDQKWEEIKNESWFEKAQELADEQDFFHWKLAYPEVFYSNGNSKSNPGFDAVIGNPPYLNAWRMTDEMPTERSVIKSIFEETDLIEGHWDLFVPFIIRAMELTRSGGYHSYIVPNPVLGEKYATSLRKHLLSEHSIDSALSFGEENVFDEVHRQTVIYVVNKDSDSDTQSLRSAIDILPFSWEEVVEADGSIWLDAHNYKIRIDKDIVKNIPVKNSIEEDMNLLGQYQYINVGATVSSEESGDFDKEDVVTESPQGNAKKFFQGDDVSRWHVDWKNLWLDYREDEMSGARTPEMFEAEKLIVRKRTGENERLIGAYDDSGYYCDDTVIVCCDYEPLEGTDAQTEFDGFDRIETDVNHHYLLSLINSSVMTWYFKNEFATGALQGTYSDVWPENVRSFPIAPIEFELSDSEREELVELGTAKLESDLDNDEDQALTYLQNELFENSHNDVLHDLLVYLSEESLSLHRTYKKLNLNIFDYIGRDFSGYKLTQFTGYQPIKDVDKTILGETTEEHKELQITDVMLDERGSELVLKISVKYQPEDEGKHETDDDGYTMEGPISAFEFLGISEKERAILETMVPIVVENEMRDFLQEAKKTITPLERLRNIEVPQPQELGEDFEPYLDRKEKAEKMQRKISTIDGYIDRISYHLYDLESEEIDIIESTLADT